MNMERIEVDGIEIITEDDRNKVQGSLKLRIRAITRFVEAKFDCRSLLLFYSRGLKSDCSK